MRLLSGSQYVDLMLERRLVEVASVVMDVREGENRRSTNWLSGPEGTVPDLTKSAAVFFRYS